MTKNEDQKYVYMDKVLQEINRNYISLHEDEKRRNAVILNEVLKEIIQQMKRNTVFKGLYRKEYYGGSYYDGLKVGKPDEYDLDLLLDLPKLTHPKLFPSDIPGFVQIHLENVKEYEKQYYSIPEFAKKLLDGDNYLSNDKVKRWMQSVFDIALAVYQLAPEKRPGTREINTSHGIFNFKLRIGEGPAFTLELEGNVDAKHVNIDVDLVPCFVFKNDKWPEFPYRQNSNEKNGQFFVVPKKPNSQNKGDLSRYWRLSFQDQESDLIKDCQRLKPALKLLKRLRDKWDHSCISSYYIKTIFLWEVENNKDLWQKPLSYVFMTMLKKYQEYINQAKILYYWNEENNLIDRPNRSTLNSFANMIKNMINDIENHSEDPDRVLKYMAIPESMTDEKDVFNDLVEEVKPVLRCAIISIVKKIFYILLQTVFKNYSWVEGFIIVLIKFIAYL